MLSISLIIMYGSVNHSRCEKFVKLFLMLVYTIYATLNRDKNTIQLQDSCGLNYSE